jgi:hypothetical protein
MPLPRLHFAVHYRPGQTDFIRELDPKWHGPELTFKSAEVKLL